MSNSILNVTAYRFVALPQERLPILRIQLKEFAAAQSLKGTILLSVEGINLSLAGEQQAITEFKNFLNRFPEFAALTYRETFSEHQPFKRLLIRIKKEIITMGRTDLQPAMASAQYIEPQQLKEWYQQGKEMLLLDTRNQYEVECGSFAGALNLKLKNFRNFPEAVKNLPPEVKKKPIVTFCTGGIRCEKAALWLEKQGFEQVYQLRGGILNYFEQCDRDFFQGKCFVFDERISI
ncbi:MAG: sulfurtransferase [Proteobacteria bacterium]|nr:sulfurtransferase [Pseudomonadota bacterium]